MKNRDIIQETFSALSSNKARTGLTMLGIIIGIASVIAMTAIGTGAQDSISNSIKSIGSNLVIVRPGAGRGQISQGRGSAKTLTIDDADAISKSVTSVSEVAPEITSQYQMVTHGKNTRTEAAGVTPTYASVRNIEIDQGSFISDQNVKTSDKVAVVGPVTRDDLFGVGVDPIGQSIRIKQVDFKVIGVTKAKGGSGFNNPDDWVFVPISTASHFLSGDQYATMISVSATDSNSISQAQADITDLLLSRHKITNPNLADFSSLNQADIIATASSVTGTFTILLAAIAGISLVVGGIGIMNMMLTTVTERTREIGLRKAIGAKRKDINKQFLIEAVALTFIGGVIGVALGWAISFGVTYFGVLQTQVSVSSVLLAFGVSALIGIVFGYYPARRAANLNPIEALRYE